MLRRHAGQMLYLSVATKTYAAPASRSHVQYKKRHPGVTTLIQPSTFKAPCPPGEAAAQADLKEGSPSYSKETSWPEGRGECCMQRKYSPRFDRHGIPEHWPIPKKAKRLPCLRNLR